MKTKQLTPVSLITASMAGILATALAGCATHHTCVPCDSFVADAEFISDGEAGEPFVNDSFANNSFANNDDPDYGSQDPNVEGLNVQGVGYPMNEASSQDGVVRTADLDPALTGHTEESDPPLPPPNITGSHLGGIQTTATEHALRLQQENESLRSLKRSLESDNHRLKNELDSTKQLVTRLNDAISVAQKTLDILEESNRRLEKQVALLNQQRQRERTNSERMLESIRNELDDALMREFTLSQ